MTKELGIVNDKSNIIQLIMHDNSSYFSNSITENTIHPYYEEDGCVWFEIRQGNKVVSRVNGRYVEEIIYQ